MESADRWRHIEELFYKASDLPVEERAAYLERECGADAELRQEVESLLNSSEQPMDYLPRAVRRVVRQMQGYGSDAMTPSGASSASHGVFITPGRELAHYKVISMLGAGGMGEVYLAEDLKLRRKVALKMLAPKLVGDKDGFLRFEQEAYAASALNHPNILTIYEFGEADGLRYIASEYVEGSTLRHRIEGPRLELNTVIDIAIQMASALAAAHSCGIVHRDIKPENVIVRDDGIVKVLDFGIAKLNPLSIASAARATVSARGVFTTEPGIVRGTAKYMSPEQARGIAVDGRTDIFSLGAVIYEMLTRRAAFSGDTASDVIAEILKTEPTSPAEFSPKFRRRSSASSARRCARTARPDTSPWATC